MSQLSITPNIELNPWTDLLDARAAEILIDGEVSRIGLLPAGMASGKAAVEMAGVVRRGPHEGQPFVVEMSWAMFRMAFAALQASPVVEMENL